MYVIYMYNIYNKFDDSWSNNIMYHLKIYALYNIKGNIA